ncbi:NADP-dependent oxidoreductase [Sphingobium sp. SCG-1]|uniref:NADP-dependent oxidoreductase n=1 Tax=Sphingobium sp. SCG-1 TaxID=2072936 RepID=UPI000CD6A5A3|nr:NADP-dependent oxidoreductase [Sphingobium sp. SCG-1]AUW57833.1 NADP-dependent oxidoreductase [Sphingobium sp. SCG-1]
MKALEYTDYGKAPVVAERPVPEAKTGGVLVKIAGAALNPLDTKIRAGYMTDFFPVAFPYVPGTDISGTIEAIGDGVSGWKPGDEIVARLDPSQGGAFAQYAVVSADQLVRAPTSMPLAESAGLVTVGGTAWQILFEEFAVASGQRVLVHGAAGPVGAFAAQLAAQAGAEVFATASAADADYVRGLGAATVIDYRCARFEDHLFDMDLVIDTVGGDVEERSLKVLKQGGTLIATPMPPNEERARQAGVEAKFVFHASDAAKLGHVAERADHGIKVRVDRIIGLEEGADAFARQAGGEAKGKIIFEPQR